MATQSSGGRTERKDTERKDEEIKRAVRERYAGAIGGGGGGCCGAAEACDPATSRQDLVELAHYAPEELAELPPDAVEHAFGCGNPLSFAGVRPGEVVLDIGSGAGIDVLLASRIVGPTGKVIGLDFTPEMIAQARRNASEADATNVEFRLGDAEHMPLDDSSVDRAISNCVINLAPNKHKVFAELFRVLKPGGRVSISDIVTGGLPPEAKEDLAMWSNCISGAIEEEEYLTIMREAGLVDVRVAARQHYDEFAARAFLETEAFSMLDREYVKGLLDQYKDIVSSVWSAKITGRKPD